MTTYKGAVKATIACAVMIGFGARAESEDYWLCKSQASQRNGMSITACGTASAPSESLARSEALLNAKKELRTVCDESDDCRNHKLLVNPQRTECKKIDSESYQCWRAIEAEIKTDRLTEKERYDEELLIIDETKKNLEERLEQTKAIDERLKEVQELERKIREKDFSPSGAEMESLWSEYPLPSIWRFRIESTFATAANEYSGASGDFSMQVGVHLLPRLELRVGYGFLWAMETDDGFSENANGPLASLNVYLRRNLALGFGYQKLAVTGKISDWLSDYYDTWTYKRNVASLYIEFDGHESGSSGFSIPIGMRRQWSGSETSYSVFAGFAMQFCP